MGSKIFQIAGILFGFALGEFLFKNPMVIVVLAALWGIWWLNSQKDSKTTNVQQDKQP